MKYRDWAKPTDIVGAIEKCEVLIEEFKNEHQYAEIQVILNIYTDGWDTVKDETKKKNLKQYFINHTSLITSFLYAFGSSNQSFNDAKSIAESIGSHLIFVNSIESAVEQKSKLIYKLEKSRERASKSRSGFNLAKENPNIQHLSQLLQKLMNYFDSEKLKVEGIFRENGRTSEVEIIKNDFMFGVVSLNRLNNPIEIAHALKNTLRESDPLIPRNLQEKFQGIGDDPDAVSKLSRLVNRVVQGNRECLNYLFFILSKTAKLSNFNKMDSKNLSIIFVPILFGASLTSEKGITGINSFSKTLKIMIDHYDKIFVVK